MPSSHTHHAVLTLLGPLQVTIHGGAVAAFRTDKMRALLAYLAVEADRPHRREALAGVLWPDQPDALALQNLRQTVARLRRAVHDDTNPTPLLHVTPKTVQFNAAAAHVDLRQFATLVRQAEAHHHAAVETCAACAAWRTEALAHYQGEFLAGLSLPDSEPFDAWARTVREQMHRQAVDSCATLAAFHEHHGALAEALRYAEQTVALEPWHEAGYRVLMRLLAQQGRRDAALAQFERCRRVLHSEFGLDPEPETTALYHAIRASTVELAATPAPQRELPRPLTALLGRATELAQIAQRLGQPGCRLLTLAGPGGVGKTRLALEAAALQRHFADGVWLVELVSVRDSAQLVAAMNQALGVREAGSHTALDALEGWLHAKHLLLVLDNFEHLLPAAPQIARLLACHPGLAMLVTSRAPLRIGGEHVLPVEPLALPHASTFQGRVDNPVAALEDYAATALFVERAASIAPHFQVTPATAPVIAAICAQLDGLPLAIELAAARTQVLAVPAVLQRLQQRLPLLVGGMRDRPTHQQTMRSTIAWSYHLLDPAAQTLFACLGVFVGGWTVDAAEALGAPTASEPDAAEAPAILDSLTQLLDHSLIFQRPDGNGEPRFFMLETIRAYALEQLASQHMGDATRRQHFAYFRALAQQAAPHLWHANQPYWLARLAAEHDNLRAALAWAQEHGALGPWLQMATALRLFWLYHGHQHEGRRWLEAALAAMDAQPDIPTLVVAHAWHAAGMLAIWDSDFAGAQAHLARSLALFRTYNSPSEIVYVQYELGTALCMQAHYDEAQQLLAECVVLARAFSDDHKYNQAVARLGTCAALRGDNAVAIQLLETSLVWMRQHGDTQIVALALTFLGQAYLQKGAVSMAEGYYREALRLYQAMSGWLFLGFPLLGMAGIAVARGDMARAATLLGAVAAFHETLGTTLVPALRPWHAQMQGHIHAALTPDQRDRAWKQGMYLTPEQAIEYALDDTISGGNVGELPG